MFFLPFPLLLGPNKQDPPARSCLVEQLGIITACCFASDWLSIHSLLRTTMIIVRPIRRGRMYRTHQRDNGEAVRRRHSTSTTAALRTTRNTQQLLRSSSGPVNITTESPAVRFSPRLAVGVMTLSEACCFFGDLGDTFKFVGDVGTADADGGGLY
ncbi:hypothetical protein FB451DRAFT_1412381 [Mycena latifolia]|nr:hypothetical protein FB451DRAFT_1412381 [Mycena latifolia]